MPSKTLTKGSATAANEKQVISDEKAATSRETAREQAAAAATAIFKDRKDNVVIRLAPGVSSYTVGSEVFTAAHEHIGTPRTYTIKGKDLPRFLGYTDGGGRPYFEVVKK